MIADWQDAQVIEATPNGQRRRVLFRSRGQWLDRLRIPWLSTQLSDVRVIVDADGNQPVTDGMLDRALTAAYSACEPAWDFDIAEAVQAALTAALNPEAAS